jgi:RND family efflux transporter MFP subunit
LGESQHYETLNAVGIVKPKKYVDIVSLGKGTVEIVLFNIGDKVQPQDVLAQLNDISVMTNYDNAIMTYNNALSSFNAVENSALASVKHAEIALLQAEKNLDTSDLNVKSAKESYYNSLKIQETNNFVLQEQAMINYNNHLVTISNTLDRINYIIDVDHTGQLPGIDQTLSARNPQSLIDAKNKYVVARDKYNELEKSIVDQYSIYSIYESLIDLFKTTEDNVLLTLDVLQNTVPYIDFNESALEQEKSILITYQSNLVSGFTQAKQTLLDFEKNKNLNKKEHDQLKNALDIAIKQQEISKSQLKTNEQNIDIAKSSRDQQLTSAQNVLDNAFGQLSIIEDQMSYLTIDAPIFGTITEKLIEEGQEITPGQKIAKISNLSAVKISADIPYEYANRINHGDIVSINNEVEGMVLVVYPEADPVTKKVRVEILYDNQNKKLIPETFVDLDFNLKNSNESKDDMFYLPLKTISMTQNGNFVYIYNEGKAEKRDIIIGDISNNSVQIVSGLNLNDKVIIEGNKLLYHLNLTH